MGQATNQAEVYKPASGVLELQVTIPPGESIAKVQFQVNGELLTEDADGTDGYKASVDTLNYPADTLLKVTAMGIRADNSTLVLRENYILVSKRADVATAATPTASAAADKVATPTTAASGTK